MRQLLFLIFLFGVTLTIKAQLVFEKLLTESKNDFIKRTIVERLKPNFPSNNINVITKNIFKIVSTPYKNLKDTSFLVVFKSDTIKVVSNKSSYKLTAYLYYPVGENKYQIIFMQGIGVLADSRNLEPPVLDDVFFANADKDKQKETIFLYHYNSTDTSLAVGKFYETIIVDDPNDQVLAKGEASWLTELFSKLSYGCDCITRDGKKYNNIKFSLI